MFIISLDVENNYVMTDIVQNMEKMKTMFLFRSKKRLEIGRLELKTKNVHRHKLKNVKQKKPSTKSF